MCKLTPTISSKYSLQSEYSECNKIRNLSPSGYLNKMQNKPSGRHDRRQSLKSSLKPRLMWALAFKMRVKSWTVLGEFFSLAFFLRKKRTSWQVQACKWQKESQRGQAWDKCAREVLIKGQKVDLVGRLHVGRSGRRGEKAQTLALKL